MANQGTTQAQAIVFGASGLNGWSIVNQLLSNYPKPETFSTITAVTNRPLTLEDSYWPHSQPGHPQLTLVSNVNLSDGTADELAAVLREKIRDVHHITHAFYFAHKMSKVDLKDEARLNIAMLRRTVEALNIVAPELAFVVYPGGAMVYGMYAPGGTYKAPLHEELPPVTPPIGDTIPYHAMREVLKKLQQGRSWSWSEITMDIIVGFAPNGSALSLAGHWATYLSCYKLIEGEGASVSFPGTEEAYDAQFNESAASTVARASIWASLNPAKSSGQVFNVADNTTPSCMRERWPVITRWFGLNGIAPVGDTTKTIKPSEYVDKHKPELVKKGFRDDLVLVPGWLDGYGFACNFDRQLSLNKIRRAGFQEDKDPNTSWLEAFNDFRRAGLILA